jgi:hypothetical protein
MRIEDRVHVVLDGVTATSADVGEVLDEDHPLRTHNRKGEQHSQYTSGNNG